MPTNWETFPVEVKGGLITNISPLQQGINLPGSARRLVNFEPSIEGGYRRIKGFNKFEEDYIPPYGEPLVQGSGQTGSTLVIANIFSSPEDGDTFTISGVTGVYTIDTSGVSFDTNTKTATLTLTTSLATSPSDKATVIFSNKTELLTKGIIYYKQKAIVYRGADIWESDTTGWVRINKPVYGTVLVQGGSQTGTSLIVDGLTSTPQQGDTFTIGSVEKVYTITSAVTVALGVATLTISPTLASSPADNAAITFLSTDRSSATKHRFSRYNYTGTPKIVGVDGTNKPFIYDDTTFTVLDSAPSDLLGADHVAEFKSHLFFAKGNELIFTAPYSDTDFLAASGGGVITIPHSITGLIVFREQLIIFSTSKIHRLVGNTISDFQLQPISLDIGCVREDTIQEVGGDIAFLGPDGVRLLSATDRIGDFGLAVASRPIQKEVDALVSGNTSFTSCVIRGKNQYRLFGYSESKTVSTSPGILGTQFADQTAQGMAWSELLGIMVYVIDSVYSNADSSEVVIFSNKDGYVYRLESGNSLDGASIAAYYSTPHFSINDPRIRKTFFKLTTYVDPEGSITGVFTPKLDFDQEGLIQPPPIDISNTTTTVSFYGISSYGAGTYGGKLKYTFNSQLVGSGFTISFQFSFESTDPPFSLDALALEYATNDRQ
jgi:hypothetical protein